MIAKKKYFDVKLELLDTVIPLQALKPELLENRTIKFDLTGRLKGKGSEVSFIIKKKNDELVGEVHQFKIYPSYIKRLIGRGISIVEDSFTAKAKDCSLRLKLFLITRKKVHRSVRKALRNEARAFLEKGIANKTAVDVFRAIASTILQKTLNKKLKKIYPLAVCELRDVKLEKLNKQ